VPGKAVLSFSRPHQPDGVRRIAFDKHPAIRAMKLANRLDFRTDTLSIKAVPALNCLRPTSVVVPVAVYSREPTVPGGSVPTVEPPSVKLRKLPVAVASFVAVTRYVSPVSVVMSCTNRARSVV
jgi:hypothetical protein